MEEDPRCRVLLVEDDAAVGRVVRRALERAGMEVIEASTASAALQIARDVPLDALLLSVDLPGGFSGLQIARTVQREYPGVGCVLMSGWGRDELERHGGTPPGCIFLAKPFSTAGLLAAVRLAADRSA